MSGGSPLVSVLISAYNHEGYVQDTIVSIVNQTYENIELIVIDDGSTDSTWAQIKKMETLCKDRFKRVHFETKKNGGRCNRFNDLLGLAKGEYLYFIASDDISKPNAIETEVKFLEDNKDYVLCVGDNEIIDGVGRVCYWGSNERDVVYNKEQAAFLSFGDFLKKARVDVNFYSDDFGSYQSLLLGGNYIPNGYLVRKSVLDNFRLTNKTQLEDYYLMLHMSKYAKMKYIDEILFSYRWHGGNTVKKYKYMIEITVKTLLYEIFCILRCGDRKRWLPSVIKCVDSNVVCYKKFGIPNILTFEKYKVGVKFGLIRLFNWPIAIWRK